MAQNDPRQIAKKLIEKGSEIPTDRHLYANGFAFSIQPTDVRMTLLLEDRPVGVIRMSHSAAKTLMTQMTAVFKQFEDDTQITILPIHEIQSKMVKAQKPSEIKESPSEETR